MAVGAERDRRGGWRKQSPQLSVEEEATAPEQVSQVHLKRYRPDAPRHPLPWRSPSQTRRWPRLLPPPEGGSPLVAEPAGPGVSEPSKKLCRGRRRGPRWAPAALPRAVSLLGRQRCSPRERGGIRGCHAGRSKVDWLGGEGRSCPGQGHLALVTKGSGGCAPAAH